MEDAKNDLSNMPDDLRRIILDHRRARAIGLREIVEDQNRRFLDDVEAEMWGMMVLPGQAQPGFIVALVGAVLSAELRKHARLMVCEANALRIAAYKQTTSEQEADIRQVYALSLWARRAGSEEALSD